MRAALVLILGLCGCSRQPAESPDVLFQKANTLWRDGKLDQALTTADAGFKIEPSWRFRFLSVKILIPRGPQKAIDVLEAGGYPASPELQAQFKMYRGLAETARSDFARAAVDL